MIISDSHNFVFVAITKTGSTSIQKHLKPYKSKYQIEHFKDSAYSNHCPLKNMYEEFPFIENYFKFAVVRNPFSWVVSWYFYRKKIKNKNNTRGIAFNEWLSNRNSSAYNISGIGLTFSQHDMLSYNNNIELDYVAKFENLQQDFNTICDKIGIERQQLPHKNKTEHKHYTEYYDEETKQIVMERFAKDIECFGYKFGE